MSKSVGEYILALLGMCILLPLAVIVGLVRRKLFRRV